MEVYLDNAATTPLSNCVKNCISDFLNEYGNPSSLYAMGKKAKDLIEDARKSVAKLINADENCIYFTSGGCASNTLAIKGYYESSICDVFYSPISHKSIQEIAKFCHESSTPLNVGSTGLIDLIDLEMKLKHSSIPCIVAIDYANSEIGTIQDVKSIIDLVHSYHGIVYLDCTGSVSQIQLNVKSLDVDMVGFSAHKLGGLKGCGVLYKKEEISLEPLVYGSQELGLFGGTENVLGILSLGVAVSEYDYSKVSSFGRDYVYRFIMDNIPRSYIVGDKTNRLPHNLNVCIQGVDAESLLIMLDLYNIQVSSGSACDSKSINPSHALKVIGIDGSDIRSCIRMTFSGNETREELDYVNSTLKKCVETLRDLNVSR